MQDSTERERERKRKRKREREREREREKKRERERERERREREKQLHFLGSGPDRGRSPVEWGDFLFVRSLSGSSNQA